MSGERARESMIVADCGKGTTRAVLVEVVDGACRYVAQGVGPSTLEPPINDLGVGLREALGALEEGAARRFAERGRVISPQEDNGDGTDAVLATVAAAPALRLAILTIGGGPHIDALLDVGRRTPTTVLPTLTLDEVGHIDAAAGTTIVTIGQLRPDLLLLAAADAPERALPGLLGLAGEIAAPAGGPKDDPAGLGGSDHAGPAILFVGDERFHGAVEAAFGSAYELRLARADGAEPEELAALVEQELLDLANDRASAVVPGFDALAALVTAPPLARSRAIELVSRFMALHFACEVLTVDLEEGASFCWARGAEHRALSEPALDLALGAANLLTTLAPADVLRWLPFGLSEDELTGWILNRAVRPFTRPVTRRDQLIEAALARQTLRTGVAELATGPRRLAPDLIVGGSFFARWSDPALAFMALLDGVQPQPANGLVQFALDRDGLLPVIGALGLVEPDRAAELFEHDGLIDLGACVVVDGKPGDEIRGRLEWADGQAREFVVPGGGVLALPLPLGERAVSLRLEPGPRSRIGRGAPGVPALFEGEGAPHGGLVGLVIDARSQPVEWPRDEQERIALVNGWTLNAE